MSTPLDIVVSGATGRMGRTLGALIRDADDLRGIGGIAPDADEHDSVELGYDALVSMDDAGPLIERAAAVIDFSAPAYLATLLRRHGGALAGRALLVGTTGIDDDTGAALDGAAAAGAVLVAANFSVGVNLLLRLVETAARALGPEAYDVEVVETHHRRKEDAPSGTALALGRAVAAGRGGDLEDARRDGRSGRTGPRPTGEIGFHALRGGDVAGEHTVHFIGGHERIALSHAAQTRELFAEGALVAARWLAGREPGRYLMADVLGLTG